MEAAPARRVEKAALRRALRARREGLPWEAWRALSDRIERRFQGLRAFRRARTVGLYATLGREVDTAGLLAACLARGKSAAFPRVEPGGRLRFHRVTAASDLAPGYRGIPEPSSEAPEVPAGALDLVVVPGLGFAPDGTRLGRGAGFYDRFLARLGPRALRVGIAFDRQVAPRLPLEADDAPLDLVVTERRLLRRRRSPRRRP